MESLLTIVLLILSNTRGREQITIGIGLVLEILVWTILPLVDSPSWLIKGLGITIPLVTIILWEALVFLRLRTDLHSFLQVLWDNEGNVYCPNCRTLFVQSQEECKDDARIHALKCMGERCSQESIFLRNDKGQPIRLRLAKKMLSGRLGIEIPLDPIHK